MLFKTVFSADLNLTVEAICMSSISDGLDDTVGTVEENDLSPSASQDIKHVREHNSNNKKEKLKKCCLLNLM